MAKGKVGTRLVPGNEIDSLVRVIRGQRVMLDSDLARLDGVPTKRLNEQVAQSRPFS